jgi:hypothetical protein
MGPAPHQRRRLCDLGRHASGVGRPAAMLMQEFDKLAIICYSLLSGLIRELSRVSVAEYQGNISVGPTFFNEWGEPSLI